MKVTNKIICTGAAAVLALFLGAGASYAQYDQGTTPTHPTQPTQQTPTTRGGQNQTEPGSSMPQSRGDRGMSSMKSMNGTTDKQFVRKAAEGNLAEVKLGELAQQNGTNSSVKDLGKMIVEDHNKSNDQLKDAAAQSHITLPTDLSKKDQARYDALSKLTGKAFDRAFARDMVRDHEHDIAAFKSEARNGKDESIKTFASQSVPTLESHLKQARQVLRSVGPSTTTRSGAQ